MTDNTLAAASEPAVAAPDVVAVGQLLLMAYQMSGQGLDPPRPANFPPHYDIVKNVVMDDFGTPTFYGFIARLNLPQHERLRPRHPRHAGGSPNGSSTCSRWCRRRSTATANVGSGFADTYKTIYLWPQDRPMSAMAAAAPTAKPAFAEQVASALQTHAEPRVQSGAAPQLPAPRLTPRRPQPSGRHW